MPATFPDSLACSFQSLGFDIRQCPEATLSELCKLSREERRILVIRDEMLSMSEVRPEKAHGIIALGTGVQTAEGFAQFVRPHLRKAAEAYFQDHITLIRGASAGAAEVVRFRHVNQGVQEKISIPHGCSEEFLHHAAHGSAELQTNGILLGGFTRTVNGYCAERQPTEASSLGLVISGRLDFLSDSSSVRSLEAGCTFLIPGDTHCAYRAHSPTEFLWLHLHPGAFGQPIAGDIKYGNTVYHQELLDYCQHFFDQVRTPNGSREVDCSHLASLIRLSIQRNIVALGVDPEFDESRERLANALRRFEENLSASLGVTDLARLAGVSTAQLYRHTHRCFEKSPRTLIEEIRIRHAKELLRHPKCRLEKVAELTGYSDAYSFSRAFKRKTGTAPREFRKRLVQSAAA